MNNPEILATLGTQDRGRTKYKNTTKQKTKQMSNTDSINSRGMNQEVREG